MLVLNTALRQFHYMHFLLKTGNDLKKKEKHFFTKYFPCGFLYLIV